MIALTLQHQAPLPNRSLITHTCLLAPRLMAGREGEDIAWWNSLLSHALSVWQGDNPDELDEEGWSAMHLVPT